MEKDKKEAKTKDATKDYGNYLVRMLDKEGRVLQSIVSNHCVVSILDLEGQPTSFEIK